MRTIFKCVAVGIGISFLTSCANVSQSGPEAQSPVAQLAVTTEHAGQAETLEPELVETYQETLIPLETVVENSAPIDDPTNPEEFEYSENVGLSEDEASERLDALNEDYELGEPFSEKDLELVRAYAASALPAGEAVTSPESDPVVTQAVLMDSTSKDEPVFDTAGFNPFTGTGSKGFSVSKKSQGVSAKFTGTLHKKAKFSGFNNTWRIDAAGLITAGRSNVKKNTVVVTFNSYGAVAQKPFVGRVYSKTVTISNGNNSNVYGDKTYSYNSFETNWTASLKQAVTTKKGKFDNPV